MFVDDRSHLCGIQVGLYTFANHAIMRKNVCSPKLRTGWTICPGSYKSLRKPTAPMSCPFFHMMKLGQILLFVRSRVAARLSLVRRRAWSGQTLVQGRFRMGSLLHLSLIKKKEAKMDIKATRLVSLPKLSSSTPPDRESHLASKQPTINTNVR